MKCEFDKLPSFLRYIIVEGVTKLSGKLDKDLSSIWPEMFSDEKIKKEWDIELKLNGKELPVFDTFELLESGLESMVKDKAEELLLEKCQDLTELISCIEEKIQDEFAKTMGEPIDKEDF